MKRLPEVPFARGDAQGVSNPKQEQGAQGRAQSCLQGWGQVGSGLSVVPVLRETVGTW